MFLIISREFSPQMLDFGVTLNDFWNKYPPETATNKNKSLIFSDFSIENCIFKQELESLLNVSNDKINYTVMISSSNYD